MSQNEQFNTITLIGGVMGQIGCLVVFLVGVSLGLGMLIDNFLGTNGIFTVLLMLGSVPITLYLIIRVSMSAAKRAQEHFDEKAKEDASKKDVVEGEA